MNDVNFSEDFLKKLSEYQQKEFFNLIMKLQDNNKVLNVVINNWSKMSISDQLTMLRPMSKQIDAAIELMKKYKLECNEDECS